MRVITNWVFRFNGPWTLTRFSFWSLNFQNSFYGPLTSFSLGKMVIPLILLTFYGTFDHGVLLRVKNKNYLAHDVSPLEE